MLFESKSRENYVRGYVISCRFVFSGKVAFVCRRGIWDGIECAIAGDCVSAPSCSRFNWVAVRRGLLSEFVFCSSYTLLGI